MIPDWFNRERLICGLMTGTSLDGIDAALCRFRLMDNGRHALDLLNYYTCEYPREIRELILSVTNRTSTVEDISLLHYALPQIYAQAVRKCCSEASIDIDALDGTGVHGQTVWHEPKGISFAGLNVASSLQLCSVSALAMHTGRPAAGDFRSADIALGGQGAPLVPVFDYNFLMDEAKYTIALNIGGMSNITLMPPACTPDNVRAFDTGPGNVLIDTAMDIYFRRNYDMDGERAAGGIFLPDLFATLKAIPFISDAPPKSTGREMFNKQMLEQIISKSVKKDDRPEDVIHTLTRFTAFSIAENIRLFGIVEATIIAAGGGTYNPVLMRMLAEELPEARIVKSDSVGIPADAKEAICFAYLAYRTFGGLPGNMPSVTGASREAVLGTVAWI